ncbi:glycosyltransferase family 2 protein [Flavobacterium sp. KACC 22763]|uniref:glycosyltransferase family 2 protein n=1 Tax=Flavobacterium sp. KACC 22763 TaxID=3025668 RepID=UPI002366B9F0|nr:glycosyltransferase family 2 protein [Flavobacterium sp. KACC 22763]WDF62873.1 glycosyltransferase family 2 protein [Flavobacterium sp. KACC 22763]
MDNDKKSFLSIITINYNNKIGLEKTIQSVISQTFKDIEYIVIDGGSKDGSKEYIETQKDFIYYWISEPDKGIFNAMNKGIEVSSGEYLLFLNSGDSLNLNTSLDDFINHEGFHGDIVYGDYKFENGQKIFPDYLTPFFFVRTSLPHQSTFFRRKVFDEMGFYNEKYKIVSDREFFIKCFLRNRFTFTHINYLLTLYDLSGISNNSLHKEEQASENERMFRENYGIFYEDYKNMICLQRELNQVKKQTISGIIKRVLNKLKNICQIR